MDWRTRRGLTPVVAALMVLLAGTARADDILRVTEVRTDRPTLHALGVQVLITDDDNRNGAVNVRYREEGGRWRYGPALFRVHPDDLSVPVPEQFAGSIFDLEPGRTYEIELRAVDVDGDVSETHTVMATTRPVPRADPATPRMVPVSTAAELRTALSGAAAGDVILLANGTYAGDSFSVSASGTADDPIVIRGESQDGVVLDGGGCTGCNVLEVYGSHVYVERLTIRNAARALRFQGDGTTGNVARRLTIRDVVHGIAQGTDQTDFTLCDNDIEGRLSWPWVFDSDWTMHWDDRGIAVHGEGHVVCHNRIVGFGDALLNMAQARSYDFHGNDIRESADGTELDRGVGNVRLWGNRFVNVYAAVSIQPVIGGPTYVLRNVAINVTDEQIKLKMTGSEPSGAVILHNTFVSPVCALNLQTPITVHNSEIVNNLFIGPETLAGFRVVDWTATLDEVHFQNNGYHPDGQFWFGRVEGEDLLYDSFAEAMASGTVETRGVLVGADVFASGLIVPAGDGSAEIEPFDVALSPDSAAVGAAVELQGINDGDATRGPDLGARELGCWPPFYGPRPEGSERRTNTVRCNADAVPPDADGGVPGSDGGAGGRDAGGDGGSSSPGDPDGEDGCLCRSSAGPGATAWPLALAVALLLMRRRRAR